jgi:hypothetical protein
LSGVSVTEKVQPDNPNAASSKKAYERIVMLSAFGCRK